MLHRYGFLTSSCRVYLPACIISLLVCAHGSVRASVRAHLSCKSVCVRASLCAVRPALINSPLGCFSGATRASFRVQQYSAVVCTRASFRAFRPTVSLSRLVFLFVFIRLPMCTRNYSRVLLPALLFSIGTLRRQTSLDWACTPISVPESETHGLLE